MASAVCAKLSCFLLLALLWRRWKLATMSRIIMRLPGSEPWRMEGGVQQRGRRNGSAAVGQTRQKPTKPTLFLTFRTFCCRKANTCCHMRGTTSNSHQPTDPSTEWWQQVSARSGARTNQSQMLATKIEKRCGKCWHGRHERNQTERKLCRLRYCTREILVGQHHSSHSSAHTHTHTPTLRRKRTCEQQCAIEIEQLATGKRTWSCNWRYTCHPHWKGVCNSPKRQLRWRLLHGNCPRSCKRSMKWHFLGRLEIT